MQRIPPYQLAWLHFLKENVNWVSQLSLASSGVTWKKITVLMKRKARNLWNLTTNIRPGHSWGNVWAKGHVPTNGTDKCSQRQTTWKNNDVICVASGRKWPLCSADFIIIIIIPTLFFMWGRETTRELCHPYSNMLVAFWWRLLHFQLLVQFSSSATRGHQTPYVCSIEPWGSEAEVSVKTPN